MVTSGKKTAKRLRTGLIITEGVACFALPAYFLFWGILSAPLFFFAWMRGGSYAAWSLVYTAGGCLGIVAVVAFVRHLTSTDSPGQFAVARNITLGLIGLAAIWGFVLGESKRIDTGGIVLSVPPSICFVHFVALALWARRSVTV